jgi:septation ring formation regulator EzrA
VQTKALLWHGSEQDKQAMHADNERRLIKKCRELNSEIVANAAKVQTALKLSEEDQMTIRSLKKEIEKAWKMVDSSYEKEARAKETISHLKLEIANLTRLVEQGAGMSLGEESTVNELLKQKEDLIRELDQKVRPCLLPVCPECSYCMQCGFKAGLPNGTCRLWEDSCKH